MVVVVVVVSEFGEQIYAQYVVMSMNALSKDLNGASHLNYLVILYGLLLFLVCRLKRL